jgi:hypothetical protein
MTDSEIKHEVNCAHCSKLIPSSAVRCQYCQRSVYETPQAGPDPDAPRPAGSKEAGFAAFALTEGLHVVASLLFAFVAASISIRGYGSTGRPLGMFLGLIVGFPMVWLVFLPGAVAVYRALLGKWPIKGSAFLVAFSISVVGGVSIAAMMILGR